LGERPAVPRESASPPFDKLVFGSFLMFPGPGFRAAKSAIWAAASDRWRLLAGIDFIALPFASANGIGACLANGPTGALYFIFPPQTIHRSRRNPKVPGVNGAGISRVFFSKPLTRQWL
jgi:hypothetical protein